MSDLRIVPHIIIGKDSNSTLECYAVIDMLDLQKDVIAFGSKIFCRTCITNINLRKGYTTCF